MAEVYNYDDLEFSNRILLRKSIMSKNAEINRIARSIDYAYHAVHILIMECFYGREYNSTIEKYMSRISPIDSFGEKTLQQYSLYLDRIVKTWKEEKVKIGNRVTHAFENVVKQEARVAREMCRREDCIPEENDRYPLLPKIKESMVKKANVAVKKAQMQTEGTEYSVIPSYPRKKPKTELSNREQKIVEQTTKVVLQELQVPLPKKEAIAKKTTGNLLTDLQNDDTMNLFNFRKFQPKKRVPLETYIKTNQKKIETQKEKISELFKEREQLLKDLPEIKHNYHENRHEYKATRPYIESATYANLTAKFKEQWDHAEERLLAIPQEIAECQENINKLEQRIATRENEEANLEMTKGK